jgi:hypothetical protein
MKVHEYREMMRYLTRKPLSDREVELAYTDHMQKLNSQAPMPATSGEGPETDYQTEVQPNMVVPPQDVLPKGAEPVMPFAPGIPNPQDRILDLADGGRIELAGGSVAKSTKNKLIDDFLKEELKNNKGKIIDQTSADLAEKFNKKYPDKQFYFNGELSPVDYKSIHYRISNNPDFKKNILLTFGRKTDPVYEDKINKAIEVYKKLPEQQKRALRTGGVGYTGALDKFMEENDLFRESSKYGSKMDQKTRDKTLFGRKLNEAGVERPEAIPQEENIKNQKLRRKEIIGNIGSTGYEKHIEDFKRNLQDYLGIEKTKLSTGKKMFPLDLAHRTDIDQLHALNQKMDPSDLGVDYYKTNRE